MTIRRKKQLTKNQGVGEEYTHHTSKETFVTYARGEKIIIKIISGVATPHCSLSITPCMKG